MSISSTVKTIMPYLKTASGYVLHRLSSQAVEMNDGTTLEQKVTSLNNLISNKVDTSDVVNNCLTTEEGFVLDARQGKTLSDQITELNGKLPDYIVEQDMSDRYAMYRKWHSGLMEVWMSASVTTSIAVPWGNMYRSATNAGKKYPSAAKFKNVPTVTMTAKTDAGDTAWIAQTDGEDATRTPNYMLVRPDAFSRTAVFAISSYSVGHWK